MFKPFFLFSLLFYYAISMAAVENKCVSYYAEQRPSKTFSAPSEKDRIENLKYTGVYFKSEVLDQGQRGFCWLYSTFSNLTNRAIKRLGADPKVSLHYISYFHWLDNAIETALNVKLSSVQEGGNFHLAVNYLRKYGVVTEQRWKEMGGSTTVQLPKESAADLPQINKAIQQAHFEKSLFMKWLKPDVSLSSSKEFMTDHFVKFYKENGTSLMKVLEPTIKQIKAKLTELPTSASERPELIFQLELFKSTVKEIKRLEELKFKLSRGEMSPDTFQLAILGLELPIPVLSLNVQQTTRIFSDLDRNISNKITTLFNQIYFGRTESPMDKPGFDFTEAQNLALEVFPEIKQPLIYFFITNDRKQKPKLDEVEADIAVLAVNQNDLKQIIFEMHKAELPVSLIYDHQSEFVKVDDTDPNFDGIMSVQRTQTYPKKIYLDRRTRKMDDVPYERGGHLVVSIGTYTYPNGKIAGQRIRNSWSDDVGQKGDFVIDNSYWGAFVDGIGVFGGDIYNPAILKILGEDVLKDLKKALTDSPLLDAEEKGTLKRIPISK
jgi:hypothetical protein